MADGRSDDNYEQIDDNEIKIALRRSGYLLEHRASQILEQRNWRTAPNYAYRDPTTGVTRELDVVGTYSVGLDNNAGSVEAVMLAECVNNAQPFAVFQRSGGISGADTFALRTGGNISYILDKPDGFWQQTLTAADARNWHHCCGHPFASQFCSVAKKKSGGSAKDWPWMASHDPSHFQCFDALYKALKHLRAYQVESIRSGSIGKTARLELYYPCLILQNELITVNPSDADLPIERVPSALYKMGVIEDDVNNVLFIDILIEQHLSAYCELLENEVSKLVSFLNANPQGVCASLESQQAQITNYLIERATLAHCNKEPPDWPPFAT